MLKFGCISQLSSILIIMNIIFNETLKKGDVYG